MTGWIGFIAGRLVSRKRGGLPVLSVLGIAVGVLALIVIISVMNGFQLGFIESILEISSYYVRVENFPPGAEGDELAGKIRALPGVIAAVPFREIQGLCRGELGQEAVVVRGLPPDAAKQDPAMAAKLDFEEGSFNLEGNDSILLGAELARRLRVGLGDRVNLISLANLTPAAASAKDGSIEDDSGEDKGPINSRFVVMGIFRSGFYEYDLGWAFIGFDSAGRLDRSGAGVQEIPAASLGIKLTDRWQDRRAIAAIAALPEAAGADVRSWREYNRAFFGALRTEKLFMFILVGLIFIVVGLNIYQAQRRTVLERREEIGLLRAVGAGDRAVRLVFVWDGLLIGLAGAGPGLVLGLLISFHISGFFALLETVVNGILHGINVISSLFFGSAAAGEGFAVFSPAVFYIKELEARVIPREAALIFLFGLFSALGAAWFASGRVARIRPAEVLRYE